jgi:hypothetical protein
MRYLALLVFAFFSIATPAIGQTPGDEFNSTTNAASAGPTGRCGDQERKAVDAQQAEAQREWQAALIACGHQSNCEGPARTYGDQLKKLEAERSDINTKCLIAQEELRPEPQCGGQDRRDENIDQFLAQNEWNKALIYCGNDPKCQEPHKEKFAAQMEELNARLIAIAANCRIASARLPGGDTFDSSNGPPPPGSGSSPPTGGDTYDTSSGPPPATTQLANPTAPEISPLTPEVPKLAPLNNGAPRRASGTPPLLKGYVQKNQPVPGGSRPAPMGPAIASNSPSRRSTPPVSRPRRTTGREVDTFPDWSTIPVGECSCKAPTVLDLPPPQPQPPGADSKFGVGHIRQAAPRLQYIAGFLEGYKQCEKANLFTMPVMTMAGYYIKRPLLLAKIGQLMAAQSLVEDLNAREQPGEAPFDVAIRDGKLFCDSVMFAKAAIPGKIPRKAEEPPPPDRFDMYEITKLPENLQTQLDTELRDPRTVTNIWGKNLSDIDSLAAGGKPWREVIQKADSPEHIVSQYFSDDYAYLKTVIAVTKNADKQDLAKPYYMIFYERFGGVTYVRIKPEGSSDPAHAKFPHMVMSHGTVSLKLDSSCGRSYPEEYAKYFNEKALFKSPGDPKIPPWKKFDERWKNGFEEAWKLGTHQPVSVSPVEEQLYK